MNPDFKPLVNLIENLAASHNRDMNDRFTEMGEHFVLIESRLDAMNARLDPQAGKIRAGGVWNTRIDAWSDTVDHLMAEGDKQISALQQRVARLERNRPPAAS